MMKIKFWGVRGSIPCPGQKTVKYGGNTACLELRFTDPERQIIIDAGSGIRELGNFMMGHDLPKGPINTEIFLTHTHWDHIMGLPFFTPIYIPGTKLTIYGPVSYEDDTLREIVGGQLTYRYFPVRQVELASEIDYVDLKEGPVDLGTDAIKLTTKYLNHPILCLGYRFEHQGKVFCTAYDTEPFQNIFCTDPDDPSYDEAMAKEGEIVAREENERLAEFFKGADLLVYDAQYTNEEYLASKIGWGHTSIETAIETARKAEVKELLLFHHEPVNADEKIDSFTDMFINPESTGDMKVSFAREGMEFEL